MTASTSRSDPGVGQRLGAVAGVYSVEGGLIGVCDPREVDVGGVRDDPRVECPHRARADHAEAEWHASFLRSANPGMLAEWQERAQWMCGARCAYEGAVRHGPDVRCRPSDSVGLVIAAFVVGDGHRGVRK